MENHLSTQTPMTPAAQVPDFSTSLSLMLSENKMMQEAARELMKLPSYSKYKPEELTALLIHAKLLGLNPFEAINSDLFILQGKVGMYSQAMVAKIRAKGHSITKDPISDNKRCILHGKRADNGDTSRASYTIEEAQVAGLIRASSNWEKHPASMLFARAASKLARELFSDVIRRGTFTEGEIEEVVPHSVITIEKEQSSPSLSGGQVEELNALFLEMPDLKERILKMYGAIRVEEIHPSTFTFISNGLNTESAKRKSAAFQSASEGE